MAFTAAAFSSGASAQSKSSQPKTNQTANIKLEPRSGSKVSGNLVVEERSGKVTFIGEIAGLAPNQDHGFHVHEFGDCSAPDAKSAGEHFNPDQKQHGGVRSTAMVSHAGDLGNVTADARGIAKVNVTSNVLRISDGTFAVSGKALVVHKNADDQRTQPSGNSGDRIGCGVVQVRTAARSTSP